MLLDADENPFRAIHCAIRLGDPALTNLLLSHGMHVIDSNKGRPVTSRFEPPSHGLLDFCAFYEDVMGLSVMKSIHETIIAFTIGSHHKAYECCLQKLPYTLIRQWDALSPMTRTPAEPWVYMAALEFTQRRIAIPREVLFCHLRSLYHMEGLTVGLAQIFYDFGFRNLNVPNGEGLTPFLIQCADEPRGYRNIERLALWFVDHGALSEKPGVLAGTTYLHVMADVANRISFMRSSMEPNARLRKALENELADDCQCYCSSKGCLPSTIFFKRSSLSSTDPGVRNAHVEWIAPGDSNAHKKSVLSELCRLEVFERLGIVNTCCQGPWRRQPLTENEIELRSEDEVFDRYLHAWIILFSERFDAFDDEIDLFWHVWWDALEKFLPPDLDSHHDMSLSGSSDGVERTCKDGMQYTPDIQQVIIEVDMLMKMRLQRTKDEQSSDP